MAANSSQRQIPQPAHRPGSRPVALPPRTLNRINSRQSGPAARTRPSTPGARRPSRLRLADTPASRVARRDLGSVRIPRNAPPNAAVALADPPRYGPAEATPGDFLAAATPGRHTDQPASAGTIQAHVDPQITHGTPILPRTHTSGLSRLSPDPDALRTTAIDTPQFETVERAATTPLILPTLYNQRGRLIVPAPLLGSREILLHQNERADRDGLVRVQDDDSLEVMRTQGMLLPLPIGDALHVDERLPLNRRYSRPWTTRFLVNLSRAHYARFHTPLQINSAVRTVEFQERLLRTNGNAAPADGASASPHLTGQAVDVAKHNLSMPEIAWLRGYLLPLIQAGNVDVEEEFKQSCFHISVYRSYAPAPPLRYVAASRNANPATLATAIH